MSTMTHVSHRLAGVLLVATGMALGAPVLAAPVVRVVRDWQAADGFAPRGALTVMPDGSLVGTASFSPGGDPGEVYRQALPGGVPQVLHAFVRGGTEGETPSGGLVLAADGYLYGTTAFGGNAGKGTIYRILPDGTGYAVVHLFDDAARFPRPTPLVLGGDGRLYGATYAGGAHKKGSLYSYALDGTYAELHDFDTTDGAYPGAPLAAAADGSLYGVTQRGGASGDGTIFRYTPSSATFESLHSMDASCINPRAKLLPVGDVFYGTCFGGSLGGAAFSYSTSAGLAVLHTFRRGSALGAYPTFEFVKDPAKDLLYMPVVDGPPGTRGVVDSMTLDGRVRVVHTFTGAPGPGFPSSPLVPAADGRFYGVTSDGGTTGGGAGYGTTYSFRP
jgi:uncharacterized repeat protein (TIGR03803 family)